MRNGFIFSFLLATSLFAQRGAQKTEDTGTTIRTETRVVLVDSVVTDKKGAYVHGLTQKDFRVWEDGKEQAISSFLFQADAPSAEDQTHYMVLFFDNSTARPQDQITIRKAASQFIELNAGPRRQIAVMEYGTSLSLTQNFTDDKDRLRQIVAGLKLTGLAGQGPQDRSAYGSMVSRGMLGAVRQAANGMARTPGRKTLVLLSAGFPWNQDTEVELNTTINACNRNNVAIYPIDIRGLVGQLGSLLPGSNAALAALVSLPTAFQVRGGGAAGGGSAPAGGSAGGASSAGSSGTRGGTPTGPSSAPVGGNNSGRPAPPPGAGPIGSTNIGSTSSGGLNSSRIQNQPGYNGLPPGLNPAQRGASLIPNDLNSIVGPQQILYALASGTGGFVIANTNDLLSGLQKIGKEQSEYYVLGYSPAHEPKPGACHTLKVKVEHSGSNIRFRTGYCDTKPVDVLSGTATERDLETKLKGNAAGTVQATIQSPFFYTGSNTARVNISLDIPGSALKFVKEKGLQQATLNVIGTAVFASGGVAARFSDSVKVNLADKKQIEEFQKKPYHYEKQFEVASGDYNLRVAFGSGGESFGRVEQPLSVALWSPDQFAIGGLALSTRVVPASAVTLSADSALIEDQEPLVVNGVRVIPSATHHFHKSGNGYVYTQVYEPALHAQDGKEPPAIAMSMILLDEKGAAIKQDFGISPVAVAPLPNLAVPVALRLPLDKIEPGTYQLAITAIDAAEHKFGRMSTIVVEP